MPPVLVVGCSMAETLVRFLADRGCRGEYCCLFGGGVESSGGVVGWGCVGILLGPEAISAAGGVSSSVWWLVRWIRVCGNTVVVGGCGLSCVVWVRCWLRIAQWMRASLWSSC